MEVVHLMQPQQFLRTAIPEIYSDLIDTKKLFQFKYNLFSAGLVYGLLHNKFYSEKPTSDIVRVSGFQDEPTHAVLNVVYNILGNNNDVWTLMCQIADGGVKNLNDLYYQNNGMLSLHDIVLASEKIWPMRAKELRILNSTTGDI